MCAKVALFPGFAPGGGAIASSAEFIIFYLRLGGSAPQTPQGAPWVKFENFESIIFSIGTKKRRLSNRWTLLDRKWENRKIRTSGNQDFRDAVANCNEGSQKTLRDRRLQIRPGRVLASGWRPLCRRLSNHQKMIEFILTLHRFAWNLHRVHDGHQDPERMLYRSTIWSDSEGPGCWSRV